MPIILLPPPTPLSEAEDALSTAVWNAVAEVDLDACDRLYDYVRGNDPEMGRAIRGAFLETTTAAAFENALADTAGGRLLVSPAGLWSEVIDLATQALQEILASVDDELAVVERLSPPPVPGRKELVQGLWREVVNSIFDRLEER